MDTSQAPFSSPALIDFPKPAPESPSHEAARWAAQRLARELSIGEPTSQCVTTVWDALVTGQWRFIELFDSDGRRLWLAQENTRSRRLLSALSANERTVIEYLAVGQSQKLVAYELGLTQGTISKLAKSALEKLGLGTRYELIELYAVLHVHCSNTNERH